MKRVATSIALALAVTAWVAAARAGDASFPIRFTTDVEPILTRYGCNSGGCHGKATGQNGFQLSLFAFDPDHDYAAIARDAAGRRLLVMTPGDSLLLRKATAQVPHGGGRRLSAGSAEYNTLARWIAAGAPGRQPDDSAVTRIVVEPHEQVMQPGTSLKLRVTAHFSDKTSRDVTPLAVFKSNDADRADCTADGTVIARNQGGLFSVTVGFSGQIEAFHGTVPFAARDNPQTALALDALEAQLNDSPFDVLLVKQWRKLGIVPSPPASDAEFIRRATLDVCGALPTPAEVEQYVAEQNPGKQAALIDRLLARPEHADYFALKWADILQNRGSGYSTSKQRAGTALFTGWIRDWFAANKPYDRLAAEIITAGGSQNENPPAVWYRQVRTTTDYVESMAQAFLGVRIQCAQCHHHPAERWSQDDYYGLAAVFARVGRKGGFADAEVPTNEIIYLKEDGQVIHPRTKRVMAPRPLGGPDFQLGRYDDPRVSLARWMTAPENPFFARTMVNRVWGHFMGRGIIDPIDDARSTNPPTHPELLDALARDFVAHGYDVRRLVRTVANSYAYRLSALPNDSNAADTQTFARFYPRRLPAESLLDAISQVLDVPTVFPGGPGAFPAGTRAVQLPDENVAVNFLEVFGRPQRESACECERTSQPALQQALELVGSEEIHRKLTAADGYVARLAAGSRSHTENVEEIFVKVFARRPGVAERSAALEFLEGQKDRGEAYRSLLWSLLATNEFMFNH